MATGATAVVDYIDGLGQPSHWNSGVGGGIGYTAKDRRWRLLATSTALMRSGATGLSDTALASYSNTILAKQPSPRTVPLKN